MADSLEEHRKLLLAANPYEVLSPVISPEDLAKIQRQLLESETFDETDGRITAALSFYTVPSAELKNFAYTHADRILRSELLRQASHKWLSARSLVDRLIDDTSDLDLARLTRTADGSWLVATCHMLSRANSKAIFKVIGTDQDPSDLALAYVLATFTPNHLRLEVLKRLLGREQEFRNLAALALILEWIRNAVLARKELDTEFVEALFLLPRMPRNAAIGQLCTRLIYWIELHRMDSDQFRLAEIAFRRIVSIAQAYPLTPSDISAILRAAEDRAISVLAVMSDQIVEETVENRKFRKIIYEESHNLMRKLFGSHMKMSENDSQERSVSLEKIINPILIVLTRIGLDSSLFVDLYESLAMDRYCRRHFYSTWLRDRPRSLILIAIAVRVAMIREESTLMLVAKEAARHARSQVAVPKKVATFDLSKITQGVDVEIPCR